MKRLIFFILALFFQSAFAQVDCSKTGAYAAGFNDERQGLPMKHDYAQSCISDQDVLNQYYIQGYTAAAKIDNNLSSARQCVDNFGQQVCGYNCITTSMGAQCAATPDQTCVKDNLGDIACGYGCASTPFEVKCAANPNESCVVDIAQDIVCGKNCRIEYGNAVCDH